MRWNAGAQDLGKDLGSYAEVGTHCETDDNTNTEVRRPALEENRSSSENSAATTQADQASISAANISAGWKTLEWHRDGTEAIELLARSGDPFSIDDVVELIGPPPIAHQASTLFGTAARLGLITKIGGTVGARGRLVRLWQGAQS